MAIFWATLRQKSCGLCLGISISNGVPPNKVGRGWSMTKKGTHYRMRRHRSADHPLESGIVSYLEPKRHFAHWMINMIFCQSDFYAEAAPAVSFWDELLDDQLSPDHEDMNSGRQTQSIGPDHRHQVWWMDVYWNIVEEQRCSVRDAPQQPNQKSSMSEFWPIGRRGTLSRTQARQIPPLCIFFFLPCLPNDLQAHAGSWAIIGQAHTGSVASPWPRPGKNLSH